MSERLEKIIIKGIVIDPPPEKRLCGMEESIVITKIDKSEFPHESFIGNLDGHCVYHTCKSEVYKQGKYRNNVFYTKNIYGGFREGLYITRDNNYYFIQMMPSDCFGRYREHAVFMRKFVKATYEYRHKDLQDVRTFVIFRELL